VLSSSSRGKPVQHPRSSIENARRRALEDSLDVGASESRLVGLFAIGKIGSGMTRNEERIGVIVCVATVPLGLR
jgi:hypothetical protein